MFEKHSGSYFNNIVEKSDSECLWALIILEVCYFPMNPPLRALVKTIFYHIHNNFGVHNFFSIEIKNDEKTFFYAFTLLFG